MKQCEGSVTSKTYTVSLKQDHVKITSKDLKKFSSFFKRDSDIRNRINDLICIDLYVYSNYMSIDPEDVLTEIRNLESNPTNSFTKPVS